MGSADSVFGPVVVGLDFGVSVVVEVVMFVVVVLREFSKRRIV